MKRRNNPSSAERAFLLRHELLNALTRVRFLVEAPGELSASSRQNLLDSLAWASFLVSQPESFYGEPSPVFLESVGLQELVDIARALQPVSCQNQLHLSLPQEEIWMHTDKNKTKELLTVLLRFTLETRGEVTLEVKDSALLFHHGQERLALLNPTPLECLQASKLTVFERLLSCLLYQAPVLKLRVENQEGRLEVHFRRARQV